MWDINKKCLNLRAGERMRDQERNSERPEGRKGRQVIRTCSSSVAIRYLYILYSVQKMWRAKVERVAC